MAVTVDLSKISGEILSQVLIIGDTAVERLANKIADEAQRLAPIGKYPPEPSGSKRKVTKVIQKETWPGYKGTIRDTMSVVKSKNVPHSYLAVAGHFTAHFLEFGTDKHTIKAKHAKKLAFIGRDGNLVYKKHVIHPGIAAKPFMEPAANKAETFLDEVISEMQNKTF